MRESEAYGCVVANRFVDLDEGVDPFDLMTEIEMAQEKRKKKKKREEVDKKKPGQREAQKDRCGPVPSAGRDPVPVNKQQERQAQGRRGPMAEQVQGARKKAALVERRSSQDAIPLDFSIPKPPFNERPESRPRAAFRSTGSMGFARNLDSLRLRGKREYDRRSGSRVSPEEKREGRGSWNWGCVEEVSGESMEATSDASTKSEETQKEPEKQNGAQEKDGELEVKIDVEMSLDEWKALQEVSRPRVEFNIRKAEDEIPSKAKVIHQSRPQEKLQGIMECVEDGHFLRKSVNDITSLLDINFGSLGRSGRKGKGSQGAPTSRPGKAKAVLEKESMVPNPDNLEEFPKLSAGK